MAGRSGNGQQQSDVDTIAAELAADLRTSVPEGQVREAVSESFALLSRDARITSFLPVLTKRMARDRLNSQGVRRRA
jgi:hypothetical protein